MSGTDRPSLARLGHRLAGFESMELCFTLLRPPPPHTHTLVHRCSYSWSKVGLGRESLDIGGLAEESKIISADTLNDQNLMLVNQNRQISSADVIVAIADLSDYFLNVPQ